MYLFLFSMVWFLCIYPQNGSPIVLMAWSMCVLAVILVFLLPHAHIRE